MKRIDLIRTIEGFGCELVRHGVVTVTAAQLFGSTGNIVWGTPVA